jgi:predicted dienelactone hydrolase
MKKTLIPLLTSILLLAGACTDEFEHPKPTPAPKDTPGTYRTDETAFPVGAIPTGVLHDTQRNKDIPLVIEYPSAGQGPFPIVVFSHGYGASDAGYVGLTEYWAGHGYVVIKPSHADAGAMRELMRQRLRERREERAAGTGATTTTAAPPAERGNAIEEAMQSQTVADWRNRVRDVTYILDNLDQLEQQYPELKGKMDRNRIGVAGHSYGALVAMMLAGVVPVRDGAPLQLADPRVKAIIAMSPQGVSISRGLSTESWRNVHIPVMYMTGSEDRGAAPNEDAAWRKTAFESTPPGDKYFVSIEGANHLSFTGLFSDPTAIEERLDRADELNQNRNDRMAAQPRSRAAGRMERERNIYATIKTLSTAFLDAYLKGAPEGRQYLDRRVNETGSVTVLRK